MTDINSFAESFQGFMKTMNAAAPREKKPAPFIALLTEHFGADPALLPVVSYTFQMFDHPNLQLALDEIAQEEKAAGRGYEITGVATEARRFGAIDLSTLATANSSDFRVPKPGPVDYKTVLISGGQPLACISMGLILARPGDEPIALLMSGSPEHAYTPHIQIEAMAATRERSERFLAEIRSRVHRLSVYRGQILSIDAGRGLTVNFHRLPEIRREHIILPDATLKRIERQTIGFARHAEALRRAGRHLKRGVLLHGPPGTGKTLTAMYLATQMKGRTVLLVTGTGHGLIEQVCWFARLLQPSTVILEDVDLIAQDREDNPRCTGPVLFELLNQMDGLAEDADVLFLLTTNRPEALEPALAARPGRIDQAVEVPLPDADCRRLLIDLYARGAELKLTDRQRLVSRTAGASAAFIKELIRRATLLACIDGSPTIGDGHMDEALRELVLAGALTKKLLGFAADEPA
ncbi:MAG: 26S protease regulatory subunit [Phycisphaerales bacterium]|nr:26S protease regulatory subunit [Phycisphaerales bacterium]